MAFMNRCISIMHLVKFFKLMGLYRFYQSNDFSIED